MSIICVGLCIICKSHVPNAVSFPQDFVTKVVCSRMLICHADLGSHPLHQRTAKCLQLVSAGGWQKRCSLEGLGCQGKNPISNEGKEVRQGARESQQRLIFWASDVFFLGGGSWDPTNLLFFLGCHNMEHSHWIGQIKVRMVTLSSVNHCLWFQNADRHVLLIFKTQETCSRKAREAKHSEQSAGQVYCKAQERRWPVLVFSRIPVKKSAVIQSVLCLQLLAGTLKFECSTNKWSFGMDLTKLWDAIEKGSCVLIDRFVKLFVKSTNKPPIKWRIGHQQLTLSWIPCQATSQGVEALGQSVKPQNVLNKLVVELIKVYYVYSVPRILSQMPLIAISHVGCMCSLWFGWNISGSAAC